MRVYMVKHKGKNWIGNMNFETSIEFGDKDKIYVGYLFFRKKDAIKYLNSFEYKQYFEVIGMTIDKSKEDNRFKKKHRK